MRPRVRFVPFAIPGAVLSSVLAAVLAAALVAGCTSSTTGYPADPIPSGGSISLSPPSSSSPPPSGSVATSPDPASTRVPADVPTTGPNLLHKGERPPVMPALATEHTPAGAIAFAKFFELTIDWGYATTSTAYMKHYYEPSCVTCKSIQLGMDGAIRKHRHFLGDRLHITSAGPAVADRHHAAQFHVDVAFSVSSAEVVDQHGNFVDGQIALKMTDRVWIAWRASGWMVTELGPLS